MMTRHIVLKKLTLLKRGINRFEEILAKTHKYFVGQHSWSVYEKKILEKDKEFDIILNLLLQSDLLLFGG